ncbi:sensor histidine kinase [Brevibacillus fluminis]|uniref:histidine kinase n=1 Tax=Brevibacillus fluminis TaxID=511487 RepID=A0A3M8DK98_9BACL|nr:HAMP domain-containing sensor histidine kinase [Brevibacillus fluminis]RNB87835.1 sensor histidine kinase [Brevibacillus fluminis]
MLVSMSLPLEELSHRIGFLATTVTKNWFASLRENELPYGEISVDVANHFTHLLARSLLADTETEFHQHARESSRLFWSERFPLSTIVRIYQCYRYAFWHVVRPLLPGACLSQETHLFVESHLTKTMDDAIAHSIHFYEETMKRHREYQEELITELHHDKLTILGKMAANMAHELRNPLCAIEGFLKLIKESVEGKADLKSYVEVVMHEFSSLNRQITGFLSFSKKPLLTDVTELVSIEELVDDVECLLIPRLLNDNISYEKQIVPYVVAGNKEEFKQVLLNLLNNAIDAVHDSSDKQIRLVVTPKADRVMLAIENNSEMIPADVLGKLFQPFFTTKANGTGIGLSICKNIIEKHKGTIHCESASNITRFVVSLPIVDEHQKR